MNAPGRPSLHWIETSHNAVGAVSVLRVSLPDPDRDFDLLKIRPLDVGQIRLVSLFDLDDVLIARFDEESLLLMPHGGIGMTRAISKALSDAGIGLGPESPPMHVYPEAEDIHEARMLKSLAQMQSPLGVDLLMEQPTRWRAQKKGQDFADAGVLRRLIEPALVVAMGNANIGKSSLVNALAGSSVAMVSDHAGTTRDHVGVMLDVAGLAVRWVDTPGVDADVEVGDELELVSPIIERADLVVHAIDSRDGVEVLDPRLLSLIPTETPIIRVGVRSDLGTGAVPMDCRCSSKTGAGIAELAALVRERLVPEEAINDPRPWRFWDS